MSCREKLRPGAGHRAAKKHGQESPVAENGDAIGAVAAVTFQLTTTGVLAREQARRKSRRFNEYDNYGPDGPEFPGF